MRLRSYAIAILSVISLSALSGPVLAETAAKKAAPAAATAQSVKTLIAANKNGGAALTQALIAAIKANPKLIDAVLASADGASPALLASISAAISQAIVEIAQTDSKAAAEIKKTVEAKAPDVLKQQVALNLASATTATASTGGNTTGSAVGPLGDVGVPLNVSTPSSTRSPT